MRVLRVPAALRERLGHNATEGLTTLLEAEKAEWSDHMLTLAEARFERRLTEQLSELRVETTRALSEGLAGIRQEVATSRVELFKWSFLFWVGQVAVIAGLLAFMLRGAVR